MKSQVTVAMMAAGLSILDFSVSFAASAEAGTTLEEVIVTAEKRSENLQNVPITVTATSGDELTLQGVKDIRDLGRVAPEVRIAVNGAFTVINIRGIQTGLFGPTADSANAFHVDGAYISRYTGLGGFFYDVERSEVLSGPQGTLYGRNSVGGTINLVTRKPELDRLGGTVSLDLGSYRSVSLQAAVNVPLGDTVAIRAAAFRSRRNGLFRDSDQGNQDLEGTRVTLLWQPTTKDTITLAGDYSHVGGKAALGQTILNVLKSPQIAINALGQASLLNPTAPCPVGNTCSIVAIKATGSRWQNSSNIGLADNDLQNTRNGGYRAQWDHDFDFATLTAEASSRYTDSDNRNGTITAATQDPSLLAAGVWTPGIGDTQNHSLWNSQEIRLASTNSATYQWTVGVYNYFEHDHDNHGPNRTWASWYSNNNTAARPGQGLGYLVYPQPSVYTSDTDNTLNDDDARAVFGQMTYTPPVLSKLHIIGGVRYNWEHKRAIASTLSQSAPGATQLTNIGPAVICPATTPAPACPEYRNANLTWDNNKTWTKTTYRVGLQFDLSESNMVYASYATGFVSGGYVFGAPQYGLANDPNADHSYNPMTNTAWEIGTKNRFFNDRLQVNLSAFKYDFKNYLAFFVNRTPNRNAIPTFFDGLATGINAGGLDNKGVNFDVSWLVTANDRVSANGQYLKSDINYDVTNVVFQAMKNFLTSAGATNTDACVIAALVGPISNCTGANAAYIAQFAPINGGIGPQPGPVWNPTVAGAAVNVWPGSFTPSGSFGQPEYNFNFTFDHTLRFSRGAIDALYTWRYRGKTTLAAAPPLAGGSFDAFTSTDSYRYGIVPSYQVSDLTLRYQPNESKWSMAAYSRNVFGHAYLTAHALSAAGAANVASANYAYETGIFGEPRTYGVQFQAQF